MLARARPRPSGPLLACLREGGRGSDRIPAPSLPAAPTDTLSLVPGLCLGPGSCCYILASLVSSVITFLPILGGLGTLPRRGCRGRLDNETWYWNGLFIKSAAAGCQALAGTGHTAVNKADAVPALEVGVGNGGWRSSWKDRWKPSK